MKCILIPSFLYLLFISSLTSSAAARLDPKDHDSRNINDVTKRRTTKYHRRNDPGIVNWALGKFPGDFSNSIGIEMPPGWGYIGCAARDSSPVYEDTILTVADYITPKGDQSCIPEKPSTSHCTLIAANLSAKIYFCGEPGIIITCSELADIILRLCAECTERLSNSFRVSGTVAWFPNWTPLDYSKLSFITIVGPDEKEFL